MCRFLALSLVLLSSLSGVAQGDGSSMSDAEGRMLDALLRRFQPLPSVERIWTGAFESAANRTQGVKNRIDSLERSGMDEAELLVRVGALRKEVRTVREDRNAFVAGFLTPLQQLALDKAEAAKKQAFSGFDLLDSHPEKVATANKHIEIKIRVD
mgnify:CR=1 FL=1